MSRASTPPALTVTLALAIALVGLSGCGHRGLSEAAVAAEPTLLTFTEPGVGAALTDPSGDTLYLFTRDRRRRATCTGPCTHVYQPLLVLGGATARAGVGVDAALIGTVPASNGQSQITYDHWPLYTYVGNGTTFSARQNGRHYDGGIWWVVRPDGSP